MGIHQVGDTVILPQHRLNFHCGSVVLESSLPDRIVNPKPSEVNGTLEPLTAAHAPEMFLVLSDPAIYEFENTPPPSEAALTERYRSLESRRSPDGREQWLNWVVRLPSGEAVGYVQATVYEASKPRLAQVAYELNSAHWRQGVGYAAVSTMMRELQAHQSVQCFVAVLKSANHRSLRLLTALGFRRAAPKEIEDFATDEAIGFSPEADECVMVRGMQTWHLSALQPAAPDRRVNAPVPKPSDRTDHWPHPAP